MEKPDGKTSWEWAVSQFGPEEFQTIRAYEFDAEHELFVNAAVSTYHARHTQAIHIEYANLAKTADRMLHAFHTLCSVMVAQTLPDIEDQLAETIYTYSALQAEEFGSLLTNNFKIEIAPLGNTRLAVANLAHTTRSDDYAVAARDIFGLYSQYNVRQLLAYSGDEV